MAAEGLQRHAEKLVDAAAARGAEDPRQVEGLHAERDALQGQLAELQAGYAAVQAQLAEALAGGSHAAEGPAGGEAELAAAREQLGELRARQAQLESEMSDVQAACNVARAERHTQEQQMLRT